MQRKQFLRLLAASLGAAGVAPLLTACGGGDEELSATSSETLTSSGAGTGSNTGTEEDLSAEEIAGLLYMREEEKLAHDVYVALFNVWGAQVFANIAESETEHTEAVRQLILSHGLPDPAATTAPGVFVNPDLQALYDKLVAMGQTSLNDALAVGCLIEEKDIHPDVVLRRGRGALVGDPAHFGLEGIGARRLRHNHRVGQLNERCCYRSGGHGDGAHGEYVFALKFHDLLLCRSRPQR